MKKKYPLIFVVEDNKSYCKIVEHHLKNNGYENVMSFASGEDCLNELDSKPDIIIQDYKLQGISGLNVLQRVKKIYPFTEFIFLSAQDNIEIAVSSIKSGAFDYIVKDEVALQRMIQKIENIIKLQRLRKRYQVMKYIIAVNLIIAAILIVWLFHSARHQC
jgi:Response regulator containing CheY-like receiver, AAA-type ATPase, and DNA-binding domains